MIARLRGLLSLVGRPRPPVGSTPHAVVWRERGWRLLRYAARQEGLTAGPPVVLVPSLINRHYVMDLLPGKSFAGFLVGEGFDVYCVDWGAPAPEDRYVTFDEVVDGALGRAIARACRLSGAPAAHVLGYCMGGTLAAIHTAVRPRRIASLTAVAAPVSFAHAGPMRGWLAAPGFDIDALVDGLGTIPAPLLQASFQLLRPTLPLAKAVNLVDRAWNDKFLDGFVALETWAGDNVDLPGEFYRTYARDLYQRDLLLGGGLMVGGRAVNVSAIRCPVACVTFTIDAIAPAASCLPLADAVGSQVVERIAFEGSHVGGMTSAPAARGLWPQLAQFWRRLAPPRAATPEG